MEFLLNALGSQGKYVCNLGLSQKFSDTTGVEHLGYTRALGDSYLDVGKGKRAKLSTELPFIDINIRTNHFKPVEISSDQAHADSVANGCKGGEISPKKAGRSDTQVSKRSKDFEDWKLTAMEVAPAERKPKRYCN